MTWDGAAFLLSEEEDEGIGIGGHRVSVLEPELMRRVEYNAGHSDLYIDETSSSEGDDTLPGGGGGNDVWRGGAIHKGDAPAWNVQRGNGGGLLLKKGAKGDCGASSDRADGQFFHPPPLPSGGEADPLRVIIESHNDSSGMSLSLQQQQRQLSVRRARYYPMAIKAMNGSVGFPSAGWSPEAAAVDAALPSSFTPRGAGGGERSLLPRRLMPQRAGGDQSLPAPWAAEAAEQAGGVGNPAFHNQRRWDEGPMNSTR